MNKKIINRLMIILCLLIAIPTCNIYGKKIMHSQNNRTYMVNRANNNYRYKQHYLNRNRQDLDVNTHNLNWVNNKLQQNRKNHMIVHHLRINRHGLLRSIRREHNNISYMQHQYVPQSQPQQTIPYKSHKQKREIIINKNNEHNNNNSKSNIKMRTNHVKKHRHTIKKLRHKHKHRRRNHKQKANANEILAGYVKISNNNLFDVTTCNTL